MQPGEKPMKRKKIGRLVLACVATTLAAACSEGPGGGGESAALSPAAAEGKQIYAANCTACHNFDPAQPGALGPQLAGSSEALLAAKVLRNEYPPGYTPKRETKAMIAMPQLEPKIPALAAYLASVPAGS